MIGFIRAIAERAFYHFVAELINYYAYGKLQV